jgi:uncharacterized protein YdiU (UPF0061 family)
MTEKFTHLHFDNPFIKSLDADSETANYRRQVEQACYSFTTPTQVSNPKLVAYSVGMANELGLTQAECQSEFFTQVFAGNQLVEGMQPYAMCYGGHQFGNWAGQLGDGRAINLGEILNQKNQRWALQLKGAGSTPYSRSADGLAVLRSSVREFLCSEAMFALGVPTTRALSLITTGEEVVRDMFYDGNAKAEMGAVVCRVAPSFLRFGSFEIHAARNDIKQLRALVDYTIRTDFTHLGEPSIEVYQQWFAEVCNKTADMIVHWQRVGFVHGVMNTDNMSILGLTIDYGPYGWLENYDPNWTPNTTDRAQRRYRFGNQAEIGAWNLNRLANGIYPLIEQVEPLHEALSAYNKRFVSGYQNMMAHKLGLLKFQGQQDQKLIDDLVQLFSLTETDMTIFYRALANITSIEEMSDDDILSTLNNAYYRPDEIQGDIQQQIILWCRRYIDRLQLDNREDRIRKSAMNLVNPKYVLRNYMAQLAIDKAEQGDNSLVHELQSLLLHPYDEQATQEKWAEKRPDWARTKAGCSMLSCSS